MISDPGPGRTRSSGTCPVTGASRSRAPRSASIIAAVAVTIFVIENHKNVVRTVTGRRARTSARPLVTRSTAPSAVTMAAARPGGALCAVASATSACSPPAVELLPRRVTDAHSCLPPLPGTPGTAPRSARTPRRAPGNRPGRALWPPVRAGDSSAGSERGALPRLPAAGLAPGHRDAAPHVPRRRARCGPSWCPHRAWTPDTGRCHSRQ